MSTAEKVAQLLLAFDSDNSGGSGDRSVSELSRIVGRERTQVCRMLKSLSQARVVEQDPDSRRYRLAWRMRVMAAEAGDQTLIRAAHPMLKNLVAGTGEVALLSVQEANRCLTVMREESRGLLVGGGWVGRCSAMHFTASGRALMFDTDDELVRALTADDFGTHTRAANAPRDLDQLLNRLRFERRRGYALASEEIEVGLTSVSVPVRNVQGQILAVLNVSGPTLRMMERIENTARVLMAVNAAITRSLGARSSGTDLVRG